MLSNFSWLQYGVFTLISLLVYYSVILLLYYRQEIKALLARLSAGKTKEKLSPPDFEEPDLVGKPALEDGLTSVGLDDLDFGGSENVENVHSAEMMQGDLADCMEELDFTIGLAEQNSWDKGKLSTSLREIAECYKEVFHSKLRSELLAHICAECSEKLDWQITPQELEAIFAGKVSGVKLSGKIAAAGAAIMVFLLQVAHAQDGNQGISEATNKVKGYFDTGTDLMYAIGAIMGLVGAVKVYSKWNAGEPDTAKVATAWFGSCIFLVVVATVLKSFFGI